MKETPKVQWTQETATGHLHAEVDGIRLYVEHVDDAWTWTISWDHTKFLGVFGYSSVRQYKDGAQAEAEYALSRELKARRYDALKGAWDGTAEG